MRRDYVTLAGRILKQLRLARHWLTANHKVVAGVIRRVQVVASGLRLTVSDGTRCRSFNWHVSLPVARLVVKCFA